MTGKDSLFEDKPLPWRELLETVFRRQRLIVAAAVAGLMAAILHIWLTPPTYTARARILLTAQPVSGPREAAMSDRQIQAELALLRSPSLIRAVLTDDGSSDTDGQDEAGFLTRAKEATSGFVRTLYGRLHGVPPPSPLDGKVLALAQRIEAHPVDRSNIVEVAYSSGNPEGAARFVNDLLSHHVERIARLGEETSARSFFHRQGEISAERLRKARKALAAFRDRHGASLLAGDESQLRQVLVNLESQRVAAETELLEQRARVGFLSKEIERHPATVIGESRVVAESESVKYLKSRILELEIERSELLSRYTPTSTLVRELERQIEEAKELLASKEGETLAETLTESNPSYQALEVDLVQTRAQLTAAEARVTALSAQVTRYREKLRDLEEAAAELERLENEVTSAREAYQTYLRKEEEARLTTALDESGIVNVSVVERAEVPLTPEPSKTKRTIMLGATAGLLLGLALAFARDWLDPSVKSTAQAERLTGLPVLAEIPDR